MANIGGCASERQRAERIQRRVDKVPPQASRTSAAVLPPREERGGRQRREAAAGTAADRRALIPLDHYRARVYLTDPCIGYKDIQYLM